MRRHIFCLSLRQLRPHAVPPGLPYKQEFSRTGFAADEGEAQEARLATPGRKAPMRMVLAIAALVSIAFGLIAVGRAWYKFRPLTDKERARLRQEGN